MERILVVEDDRILNMTLSYNLKSAGYEVESVMNAADAKAIAVEHQFALVVLDVNLPDGNGYEVCRAIKEKQDAAVIFVTAQDMESDMLKGYECGADDYVTKPFSVAVFQKKVA
ncbi:response regulator, partial [Faecalicatena contorta]